MSTITFTATLANGEVVTRTSGTMPYVATVDGVSWHKTFAAAYKAANTKGADATVYPVTMAAFNGKISPEWEATMASGWGDITATAMAELIIAKEAKGQKAKPAPELPTEEAPAVDPEPVVEAELVSVTAITPEGEPGRKVSKKQALGAQIHALIHAALADDTIVLPEGMDYPEARESIAKWLQHVPSPENPGGRAPRPSDATKKAARAKA